MVELKKKTVSKKVVAAKPKTKAGSVVSAKKKTAASTVTTAKKKVTAKKTVVVVSESKKAKPSAVKKESIPAVEIKVGPKKVATSKTKSSGKSGSGASRLSPEERNQMVETAAYFIAERNGFQDHSDMYWAAAEREISDKLGQ
jgi:hypothetical protein